MKKRKLPLMLLLMMLCLFGAMNAQAAVKTVRLNKTYTDRFTAGETSKSYTLKVDKSVKYVDIYVDANFLQPPYVNRVCELYCDSTSTKKAFAHAYAYSLYSQGPYSFTKGATSEIYFSKDMMKAGVKSFRFRVQKHRHRWGAGGGSSDDQCVVVCDVCGQKKVYRKHDFEVTDLGTRDGWTTTQYVCKRCGYKWWHSEMCR